nr:hypothetical protein [Tanacetum cinerariifolium]
APAGGVVIRETPEMPLSKKKEKVDVARGNGIELLSEVALIEEAQYEEVQRKSLRNFHKTHPSGSDTVTKTALSAAKIKPSVTNEGTGVKPGVPDVTEEKSSETKSDSCGNDEDDINNEQGSRSNGIELLSEVALIEEAQYEEVQRKSLRNFHKTHPSGSDTVTKTALSAAKIKPSVTNEGTGVKPGVPDVTEEKSSETKSDSCGNDEDDINNEQDSRSEGSDE